MTSDRIQRRTDLPPGDARRPSNRYVLYERDDLHRPYAVEVVTGAWDDALLECPDRSVADVRILQLETGAAPADLPRWLRVLAPAPGAYASQSSSADQEMHRLAEDLWPWSPHYREPGPSLSEFLSAAASAVQYPAPSPAEVAQQTALLAQFAAGRPPPLDRVATLRADALERWLLLAFGDPDELAIAILLERIADSGDGEAIDELRFLHDADVPELYAELYHDRGALLDQASPWRFFDAASFGPAIAATRAWRSRYRLAYDAHYRSMIARAGRTEPAIQQASAMCDALRRLDGIPTLGAPIGEQAIACVDAAVSAIRTLPERPDPATPRTAGVRLGEEWPAFAQLDEAIRNVNTTLERKWGRPAAQASKRLLTRSTTSALAPLLLTFLASRPADMSEVLDDRLAHRIEEVLTREETLLSDLAQRYPVVTFQNLDEAVEEFRAALGVTLAAAADGQVRLV